jgi:hypothetical protein
MQQPHHLPTVPGLDRRDFDHVGIPTDVPHEGELWVAPSRVWVTNPRLHPLNIEWLRFEADSPVTGPLRELPHIAYRVLDLEAWLGRPDLIWGPIDVGDGFIRAAFILVEEVPIELMQYRDPDETGWFA